MQGVGDTWCQALWMGLQKQCLQLADSQSSWAMIAPKRKAILVTRSQHQGPILRWTQSRDNSEDSTLNIFYSIPSVLFYAYTIYQLDVLFTIPCM